MKMLTIPVLFVLFLALFFLSWGLADKEGSKTAYVAMVISGACAAITAFMIGGLI